MVAGDGETGRANSFYVVYGRSVMSAQMLEVSLLLGVGTVLRLERDAWSMVKRLRQEKNECATSSFPPS